MGVCEGGGFSERSPSLALPPEEQLGIGLVALLEVRAHATWSRFPVVCVVFLMCDRLSAFSAGSHVRLLLSLYY